MPHRSLALLTGLLLWVTGCAGARPDNLGVSDGALAPCPTSPNCVSSFATDPEHAVEPLRYSDSQEQARERMLTILADWPRCTIIEARETYLYAELRSAVWGFVDDLELLFSEPGRIDVRSASRVGYGDMGVNRARVDQLRRLFAP